jgi:hypothetical protein
MERVSRRIIVGKMCLTAFSLTNAVIHTISYGNPVEGLKDSLTPKEQAYLQGIREDLKVTGERLRKLGWRLTR